MQAHSLARSKILDSTSYELKLLLLAVLLPGSLISFFVYIIISIIDVERSGSFNSIPSSIILAIGVVVSLRLLLYTKLEKIEIYRFRYIFLSALCWLIGELIYVYNQAFLGIAVPYPSIADVFYLSATVFLSFHLFSILRSRKSSLKNKSLLYLGFLASIVPIYLLADTIFNYEEYPNSELEFVVNASYYISDAVVIFPCIPIILSSRKNDPFSFHWLLITLSVFTLVAADLAYTYVASQSDELIAETEWLWTFIFSIGYLLLTVSLIWFSKIKDILEYQKYSEHLRNEQRNDLDDNPANEFVERFENPNQILKNITKVTGKAEQSIDILFARYIIPKGEVVKLVDTLAEMTKKHKLLDIRILLPSSKFEEGDIPSVNNPNISIKYFDRQLGTNTITSIQDSDIMYILGSESGNARDQNWYFIKRVENEQQIQVNAVLFERMWLLEKCVDFG